jgi:superfamily II DNA/RNA helicase
MQRVIAQIRNGILPEVRPYSPYILVLVPTTELAWQVAAECRQISDALKFRTCCLTASSIMDNEHKKLRLGRLTW